MKRLSRFVHIFDDDRDHVALFHSAKVKTVFVQKKFLNLIKSLPTVSIKSDEEGESLIKDLEEIGFVVSDEKDDNQILEAVKAMLKPNLTVMYLILTENCNLACEYCFIEAGFSDNYHCKTMDWHTAKKALEYFSSRRDKQSTCQVWFYGGEPFLNEEVLFKGLDFLKSTDPSVTPIIISNGTLIKESTAKKLRKYPNLQITISLDGPREVHNQKRFTKTGEGSYDKTITGIDCLKKAGVHFGVSCTIAEHNVNKTSSIAEWVQQEIGTPSIGMNLLVDTPKKIVDNNYIRLATSGLIDFFSQHRNEQVFESRVLRKVDAFVRNKPRVVDCAACGRQIVVAPDGEIGICHEGLGEKKFFVGELSEEFDFDNNSSIKEWATRSPFNMPECLGCEALGICGGGCPYGAMLRYGSIWDVDRRFCVHSKDMLNWLIWDLYDKISF